MEGDGSSEPRTQGATRTDMRERPRTPDRADPPPAGKGLELAYRYLNKRERTVAEVRARLEKAEIPEGEIDAVVAELVELGYVNDARYARVFTEDKRALEAWGNERIARALRGRGIDGDLIEAALTSPGEDDAEAGEPTGEFGRAVALLVQRFPVGPAAPRDRERAFGVLVRKGYESETAADAVREWARRAPV
ncbi:MAG TPA: RecX family transcriptional regulator [Solirubrobacteraceae bacterium]|nr:RecX family transcriptional regulator [Solirubrobacteraceae bacterium]